MPNVEEIPVDEAQQTPDSDSPVDTDILDDISNFDPDEYFDWNELGFEDQQDMMQYLDKITEGGFDVGGGDSSAPTPDEDEVLNIMTNSISGVFGIPYQFSSIVDPPVRNSETVGRKYMEKILSVMPILFLTPGEPVFMDNYGQDAKQNVADKLLNNVDDNTGMDDLGDGKYYSFNSMFGEYAKYVNLAARALAQFMGIGHVVIPGAHTDEVKLSELRLEDLLNSDFSQLFGANTVVPFYLDAETTVSEDFSNDTSESMLSQKANQFSDIAREIQFIAGTADPGGIVGAIKNAVVGAGANILDSASGALDNIGSALVGSGLMSRLTNELTTIVTGGKIIFPEIWSGSSYSRSYSINLKLRSPDPDPLSIFLNIYLPIILLVSMAAPRQLNNSANSYESPFLVRATYKSIFNCELGLITSLSISKGGEDMWNTMGMPITADVTVTIKDLYSNMFISKNQAIMNNTAQMDYLSLMAGLDMNELDLTRMVKLGVMIYSNKPRDFVKDRWGGIKGGLNKAANRLLGHITDTRFLR